MPKRLDRKWIRIAIYYAIALGFSFLARVSGRSSHDAACAADHLVRRAP